MGRIITQASRISHKGVSTQGVTFSIPNTNDFTDGTWAITDLANKEIGVNRTDKKVFMRIDNSIKEMVTSDSYFISTIGGTPSIALSYDLAALNINVLPLAISFTGYTIGVTFSDPTTIGKTISGTSSLTILQGKTDIVAYLIGSASYIMGTPTYSLNSINNGSNQLQVNLGLSGSSIYVSLASLTPANWSLKSISNGF